ncbi:MULTISPECIES: lipopolysaccharide kinase InaA family protein [unclassified Vibrio]|uniref:Lipopolysaccharide kinase InaA family protein n=1 Tax=Vibrio sp. HB236076 TaxID=3232307 RepID=A0AB39HD73_9VIBR|nr:lipopolysaccharide kinase InaA family protein [Vibrio sp. HB161653]MDP5254107.1 lipopolysaccharide kinase InaA family protein [Vibrio sp. HB161653]
MLLEKCIDYIDSNTVGVTKIIDESKVYWLKINGEDKSNFIRKCSAFISHVSFLSFLQTKSTLDSFERFEHERVMLHFLSANGFNVPEIELEGEGYFVTADKGVQLKNLPEERITDDLLANLFTLFARLHNTQVAHGRPALRDILVDNHDQISLIDFEESTMDANSSLKARDIFLLLMDLCRLTSVTEQRKLAALMTWKNQVSSEEWQSLQKIFRFANKCRWIAKTVLSVKPKNRASQQLIATLTLLERAF